MEGSVGKGVERKLSVRVQSKGSEIVLGFSV